jgi:hypothetical protein
MSKPAALLALATALALAAPATGRADDPGEALDALLEELTERQGEPLGAVLAELRAKCAAGEDEEACAVTALRAYLLGTAPPPEG